MQFSPEESSRVPQAFGGRKRMCCQRIQWIQRVQGHWNSSHNKIKNQWYHIHDACNWEWGRCCVLLLCLPHLTIFLATQSQISDWHWSYTICHMWICQSSALEHCLCDWRCCEFQGLHDGHWYANFHYKDGELCNARIPRFFFSPGHENY